MKFTSHLMVPIMPRPSIGQAVAAFATADCTSDTPLCLAACLPALLVCCLVAGCAAGLLVAEVSLRLMQERGAGSVSMISMASSTLGPGAAAAASGAYIFLHYALLVSMPTVLVKTWGMFCDD